MNARVFIQFLRLIANLEVSKITLQLRGALDSLNPVYPSLLDMDVGRMGPSDGLP